MDKKQTVTISDLRKIDTLSDLWQETIDIWQHGFMGVDIGNILTAIAILGGFLLIRGIFSKYVLSHLHNWTKRTTTRIDDKIVTALIPPIKFIPVIVGIFIAAQYSGLSDILGDVFTKFMRSIIAFNIFWALHRALEPVSHMIGGIRRFMTSTMANWLFRTIKVLVIFVGGAVILEIWGIKIGPLLAGLGLFGAAVALGAQDLFKNLIGGITVIAEKKFHPGDWIMVEGVVEGVVEDIGFRSTVVRRFDKAPVHVPNSQLSDAVITNFSRMTHRRIFWKIGVVYSTTTEQLKIVRDGIEDYILNNEEFESPENVSTFVRVDSFNASSIDFMVYCFTKTTVWGEWLKIKEELAFKIKEVVEEQAKSSFAFPSQSVYLESFPTDQPEIFVPPSSLSSSSSSKSKKSD